MGRPTKQQTITAEMILDRIEKSFSGMRWQDLSMGQVAKKLKIKPPSLYHHFDGIEDLRRQLTLRSLQRFYSFIETHLEKHREGEPLDLFATAYRKFARQYPLQFDCAQFGISSQDADLAKSAEQIVHLAIEALRIYKIPKNKTIHAVRILRSSLNGFIELEMNGGFQMTEDIDKSFQELVKFLTTGLKNYT